MATFPPDVPRSKRDQPLIMIGIVMAMLLIVLLALPFLTRTRHGSPRRTISSSPDAAVPGAITR